MSFKKAKAAARRQPTLFADFDDSDEPLDLARMFAEAVRRSDEPGGNGDPLMHFTEQLDAGSLDGHSETANLTSVFACAGAAFHQLIKLPAAEVAAVDHNLALVPRPTADWIPLRPNASLRSRIVLLESRMSVAHSACPEAIRREWLDAGCIVTGYRDGRVRISLPH